jgi:hypothetical protein
MGGLDARLRRDTRSDRAPEDHPPHVEHVMKTGRHCMACGSAFQPRLQTPNQHYCSDPACQRERRRRWQRQHLRTDPDYRENQARAQANWRARHPGYWRQYRAEHPTYCDRNRVRQRARRSQQCLEPVANMNAPLPGRPLASGFYILHRAADVGIAKMNACTVHIAVLSAPTPSSRHRCKEMT